MSANLHRGAIASLVALALVSPRPADAWNSKCSRYENPTARVDDLRLDRACCEGPDAPRGRLRSADHQDEHSEIFRDAVAAAGLPHEVVETTTLRVYTAATTVPASYIDVTEPRCARVPDQDSLSPVAFETATRERVRAFSVDELAMLPDFSYSLWDWLGGNETCPLRGYEAAGAIDCHIASSHMGMANANHFPPMSDRFYARLHAMARARAQRCSEQRDRVPTDQQQRFGEYWRQCETEALALESYAQHYLQDSFSSGHMWERWGPTDVDRFPSLPDEVFSTSLLGASPAPSEKRRLLGVLVGLTAGLVHGVEPISLFSWLPDALCHPYPDVRFTLDSGYAEGAGDTHYWADVRGGGALGGLQRRLVDCAASGVREVYDDLSNTRNGWTPVHGELTSSMATMRSPTGPECAGMRATNAAMFHGMGVDSPVGLTHFDEIAASSFNMLYTMLWAPLTGVASRANLSSRGKELYTTALVRLGGLARLRATLEPDATDIASLQAVDGTERLQMRLMGAERNSHYTDHRDDGGPASLLASYQEPELPWPVSADAVTPEAGARGALIARAFQRAHIGELCATESDAYLERLRAGATARSGDAETDRARCDVCAEVVARHLRIGRDASEYNHTAEPVCRWMPSNTGYAYQTIVGSTTSPRSLARVWCGCQQRVAALTDMGLQPLTIEDGRVTRAGDRIPTPTLPRDMATTSDMRGIVTHSDGTVEVIDMDRGVELDTDANESTMSTGAPPGVTRLNVGSGARGVGVVDRDGESYALIGNETTDEVLVYRLGTREAPRYELCERFNAGRDASRIEDPWDVLVMPDGLRAYVSFRGAGTNLGDAIAIVDIDHATDCRTGTGEIRSHLSGVFGARAGIGAMALSPDGSKLLVTARRAATCTVSVLNASNSGRVDYPVGCDSVILMDPATDSVTPLPTAIPYFRTMPTYYPYAVAWFPDGNNVAFAQFGGPDLWPQIEPLHGGGAVRLGDARTGDITYHASLTGNIIGESLLIEKTGRFVYAATTSGDVVALPGLTASGTRDAFWTDFDGDPENAIHGLPSWYGGCRTASGRCVGGWCPAACTEQIQLNLGSSIRALIRY